ncbi:cytochrome P450 [Dactylosporangium sp. CA-233914]|uniref:cytochrome P450 n=1 Tax=Dactylosporangium sp. CA-233914 TaxID=3239934 RepID=UPI003D8E522E
MTIPPDLPAGTLVSDVDPYTDAALEDPTEFHDLLLGDAPLVWLTKYGAYAVGRHETVREGLRDWRRLISSAGVGLTDRRTQGMWRTPSLLLEADPPEHTSRRAVLNRMFSPRALGGLEETFDRAADALMDEILEAGTVDGVRDIAEAYPLKVFTLALGLPPDIAPHLVIYGDVAFNATGPANERTRRTLAAAEESIAVVTRMTQDRNLQPGSLGALLWEAVDAGELAADEAPMLMRSILGAGVDTTVAALASAIHQLATHPGQWARLARDPGLAKVAFDEAIRVDSAVQMFYRLAVTDTDLPGPVRLPADSRVLLSLGAANRDPRRYEHPHRFDVMRAASGHVGFGVGIHACVGMHLARLEGQSLLSALARKAGSIEPAGKPERLLNNTLRCWGSLPITVHPPRSTG